MQAWMNIFQEQGFAWSNGQSKLRPICLLPIFILNYRLLPVLMAQINALWVAVRPAHGGKRV